MLGKRFAPTSAEAGTVKAGRDEADEVDDALTAGVPVMVAKVGWLKLLDWLTAVVAVWQLATARADVITVAAVLNVERAMMFHRRRRRGERIKWRYGARKGLRTGMKEKSLRTGDGAAS